MFLYWVLILYVLAPMAIVMRFNCHQPTEWHENLAISPESHPSLGNASPRMLKNFSFSGFSESSTTQE